VCLTLRRTGTLAFAIGFHAAFDFANLFLWSGQNAGEYAVGHLLETAWNGPQWLTGGPLGPEASRMVFVVIALMFCIFNKRYRHKKFPLYNTRLLGHLLNADVELTKSQLGCCWR
jgi:hypothetical protein